MVEATSNDVVAKQLIEYLARRRGYRWKKLNGSNDGKKDVIPLNHMETDYQ